MSRLRWIRTLAAAVVLASCAALAATVPAQEPKPAAKTFTEKVKATAGSAVNSIKKGAASAGEAISEQYDRARSAVSKMGTEARVYARIHWEKGLATSKVELSAPKEGVIALNGTASDEKARAKAVELANDTIGVTQVIDNLKVQTVATTAEPPKP